MSYQEVIQKKKEEWLDFVNNVITMRNLSADEKARANVMLGVIDEEDYVAASFNEATGETMLCFKASCTEGVNFDGVVAGDAVEIVRERGNSIDRAALEIRNGGGYLGMVPNDIANALSPLMDGDFVEIMGSHVSHVRMPSDTEYAALYVEVQVKLADISADEEDGCVVCLIGSDFVRTWAQELNVLTCSIPLEDAKLLFEVYNYTETDDLMAYLEELVSQEPDRYGCLSKYYDADIQRSSGSASYAFKQIFLSRAVDKKDYYWFEHKRVTHDEMEAETAFEFNHWYEVIKLYPANKELPFDLKDEDMYELDGYGGYKASADLSYGC